MKRISQTLLAAALLGVIAPLVQAEAVKAVAQPASLQSGGGVLTLDLEVQYTGQPGAMGLALDLPDGWSFVGVGGVHPPQIVPPSGTTESVECAWMSSPADGAKLQVKVAYPAGANASQLTGTVQLRRDGEVSNLKLQVSLES